VVENVIYCIHQEDDSRNTDWVEKKVISSGR